MLRYYEENSSCCIVIDTSFQKEDIKRIEQLFEEEYATWIVEFVNIYTIDALVVQVLYNAIIIEKKNILLYPQKERVAHYLHKLGFETHSLIEQQDNIIDAQNIKVVLLGGSMDSTQKVIEIVKSCNFHNLSFIIIQHQQAKGIDAFDEILQKYTYHKVSYAKDMQIIKKGRIYIAPSDKHLLVENGYLALSNAPKYNFAKPSISLSYESFSNYYKNSLLVIQECGYLNDGVDKLSILKQNGSKIIIQDKKSCKDDAKSMVLEAEKKRVHDFIFDLEMIIEYINFLDTQMSLDKYLEFLVDKIYKIYGYDFRSYHKEMLQRRFEAFMIKSRTKSIKNIVGAILFQKNEFKKFLLELSINVTEFFRNPLAYQELQTILDTTYKHRKNLKIWSAGCSSGEEAISIAILLKYLNKLDRSVIYATDFNKIVLQEAKNGLYSLENYDKAKQNLKKSTINIPLENYFTIYRHFVNIKQFIKEKILYFEHNLAIDNSFNEFDIIICSNVLIYFGEELQRKVIKLFYDSLKFGGYLILGEKELLHRGWRGKFEKYSNETPIYKKIV